MNIIKGKQNGLGSDNCAGCNNNIFKKSNNKVGLFKLAGGNDDSKYNKCSDHIIIFCDGNEGFEKLARVSRELDVNKIVWMEDDTRFKMFPKLPIPTRNTNVIDSNLSWLTTNPIEKHQNRINRTGKSYMTVVGDIRNKFQPGQVYSTPWGEGVKITSVKEFKGLNKHPYTLSKAARQKLYDYLNPNAKGIGTGKRTYQVVEFKPVKYTKGLMKLIDKK
jgi:hypothetical protein